MKRVVLFVLIFTTALVFSQSERKVDRSNLLWFGDFGKFKLKEKWSLYLDVGLRRTEWLNKWSQTLVRVGITYSFNSRLSATAGLAYFNHYATSYIRPEYRGWQQLLFADDYGRARINHRLRAEQRFTHAITNNSPVSSLKYTNRFRYQLSVQIPLNKNALADKTLYVVLSDEIMINCGREVIYNYFDQNRLAAGLGYKYNEYLNMVLTYTSIFIQRNQPEAFENNKVIVLNLYHNFDLSKKK
ncbi:MAG: DUF2490 domain-containing protein [Bacteroidota bacterium]|nr:DUF2490 domain-containing protein [Bacteroidota bacterium]